MKIITAIICSIENKPYLCHILIEPAATDKRHKIMRTINQIEALVNANRISEREAIEYIVDNYGDESDNFDKIDVVEEYCEVDCSGISQNVSYVDYVCSGYIVDWSYWHHNFYKHAILSKSTGELEIKIYHTNIYQFVDGQLVILRLYDVLTETQIR